MNYIVLILAFSFFFAGPRENHNSESAAPYCELKGSACIVDNPQQADYKIYIDDSEAFADMLVFKTDNSLYADKPGVWYFVKNRGFANFTIYLVDAKGKADFSIYYTTIESMAGCN